VWFRLDAAALPLAVRAGIFLLLVHLALSVVGLPLGYYSGYVVAHAFGLSRQTRRDWAIDWLKGVLVAAALGTLVAGAFLWTVIATGPHWWWVFGIEASLASIALVFVMPYVLVPLFFKMRPLDDADTAARIRGLVDRAGAPVRDICTLDFSRRTAEANAAVIGLGRSRRVVLADTLLAEFSSGEVDAVVAHELGHHVHHDVQRLLVGNGVLMWIGLAAAAWARPALLPVLSLPSLAYVPGYPVVLFVVELFFVLLGPLLNWWSRRLEARADRFALELTRDPAAFVGAMERIASQNLAERHPPRWAEVLLATHPPLYRRIEMARNWKLA
jgi:STE24 endopeptidase